MKRVAVVGGGITGLAAAFRLSQLSQGAYEVVLLEASDRLGGKILTERSEGCVFELGPDSFMTAKPQALELVRELGLESRLMGTDPGQSEVFVYARGRMRRIPEGMMLMAPANWQAFLLSDLLTWNGKLRLALDWFVPAGKAEDESLGDFARRRLGKEALETLVQPVMAGIYAGDADQMSLKSTFPQFWELERRHSSVIRGLRRGAAQKTEKKAGITMFMTLAGGLAEMTQALARRLGGLARTGAAVRSVRREPPGYRLNLERGEELFCDAAIVAAQAWQAAEMVSPLGEPLAGTLRGIPFASTATVSLAYETDALSPAPSGFGFVVTREETRWVSAATFSSVKFPGRAPRGTFLIRCFLGGVGREALIEESDAAILEGVRRDLRRLLGIETDPKAVRLSRWMRANPQYTVGHEERLRRIEACLGPLRGLWLAGASYYGVGIPDCIASGSRAAREACAYLKG